MPTYEYACKSCGDHLEVNQKFTDAALTECPNCGGLLRKVFGAVGISFKGSGFYKNDSRSETTEKPAKDAKQPAAEASSTPAPESSPAPKADAAPSTAAAAPAAKPSSD